MSSKGRDMEHEMDIDLISALRGFETELAMQKMKPCDLCNGSGIDPKAGMTKCTAVKVQEGLMWPMADKFHQGVPQVPWSWQHWQPCPRCSGQGQVYDTERIRVTIPKG
jgi:molecular chaperone DnaJ